MLLWLTALLSLIASLAAKLASDQWLSERVAIIGDFVGLHPSTNPGVAFGMRFPDSVQLPLILGALLLIGFMAHRSAKTTMSQVGFGLIIGGALGNIVDRLRDGLVTDFFQVGTFPIFNVADSCISVGVVLLLFEMTMQRRVRTSGIGNRTSENGQKP
jgi:signal peptidase II